MDRPKPPQHRPQRSTCLLYTSEKDADRFIALIDKYENFDKLTIAMLNEFIEKILVHERDRKGSIQTLSLIHI